jgi:hypothetical protein
MYVRQGCVLLVRIFLLVCMKSKQNCFKFRQNRSTFNKCIQVKRTTLIAVVHVCNSTKFFFAATLYVIFWQGKEG